MDRNLTLTGFICGIISMGIALWLTDWKVMTAIFVMLMAHNIERH